MRPPTGNRTDALLYIGISFSVLVVGLCIYSKAFRWAVLLIYLPLLLLCFCIRGIAQWFKRKGRRIESLPHGALVSTTAHHSRPDQQRDRHDVAYAAPKARRGEIRLDDDITITHVKSGLDVCRLRP
jgi:hypothetical protein